MKLKIRGGKNFEKWKAKLIIYQRKNNKNIGILFFQIYKN